MKPLLFLVSLNLIISCGKKTDNRNPHDDPENATILILEPQDLKISFGLTEDGSNQVFAEKIEYNTN